MRRCGSHLILPWIVLGLLFSGGCTVSITPWHKPTQAVPVDLATPPAAIPGIPGLNSRTQPPAVMNESVAQLIKQHQDADDHRRALLEQVQTLKRQLKDREENLRHASHEVEESTKQLKRTRDDFRNWQAEMEELRDRIAALEKSRATLRPLIEDILNHLERPKEPSKLPSVGGSLK